MRCVIKKRGETNLGGTSVMFQMKSRGINDGDAVSKLRKEISMLMVLLKSLPFLSLCVTQPYLKESFPAA